MSTSFIFRSKIFVSGTIQLLSGMHIGGNSTEMGIGGADKIVVRDPLTNHPYIPGSSLRGKMRSLFEKSRGEMTIQLQHPSAVVHSLEELDGKLADGARLHQAGPASDPEQDATKLFGLAIDRQNDSLPVPQRLVVRDAKLTNAGLLEQARNTDMPLTEVKTEVCIDRITSKANPRQLERIPAGAEFKFDFVLSLYGDDDEAAYTSMLFECMQLLQDDYLGGHGGRGYGKVAFKDLKVSKKSAEAYRNNQEAEELSLNIPESLRN